jgi:hypothetical protein
MGATMACAQSPFERPPARGLDLDAADLDNLAARPDLRKRLSCKPFVHQAGNYACVEAERCEQWLRHAIAARDRKQGESTALLGS